MSRLYVYEGKVLDDEFFTHPFRAFVPTFMYTITELYELVPDVLPFNTNVIIAKSRHG